MVDAGENVICNDYNAAQAPQNQRNDGDNENMLVAGPSNRDGPRAQLDAIKTEMT